MATIVGPLTDTFRAAQRGPHPESVAVSTVNLGTSQTANEDSTNTADRGNLTSGGFLRLVTTVGSTPTITVNIRGSINGTDFYNIPYALVATPSTFVITAITITTAVTNLYLLQSAQAWKYIKLVYSANTNVTITADVWFPAV